MKYPFLSLIFLFIFATGTAQVNYEEAYYINNTGERVNGFIKNEGWNKNPSNIEFKKNIDAESELLGIMSVSEFGIQDNIKYVRAKVAIDRSSDDNRYLTTNKAPNLEEETLFLKVLIEGDASLYTYKDNNLLRFFYTAENVSIQQLIYKRYRTSGEMFGKNEQYKQQLFNNLKCEAINMVAINKLVYGQSELISFFKTYNNCKNAVVTDYQITNSKGSFGFTVRPGVRSASFSFKNAVSNRLEADFDNKTSFTFGLELEYIMPFNRNKWSVIFEPTYQYYKSSTENKFQTLEVNYSSIELPLGIRHYLFLSESSKFFVNASFVLDLAMDSKVLFELYDPLDITSGSSIALGLGFKYNNKYSVEVRYQTDRSLLQDYAAYNSKYSSVGLLVGYTLF